tara:strand:+ start:244 stop:789 length:546 start_codon:yes stop_codon:yes gene_type:complete
MDFNSIYLCNDIIECIFLLLDYNDKFSFSCINHYTRKYKDTIKYLPFTTIYSNYRIFKECFKRYTYTEDELLSLGVLAVKNINTIWGSTITGYYDLRYIFELLYAGLDHNHILINSNIKPLNLKVLMDQIKYCISFNRFETINNINNNPSLYSLRRLFNPICSRYNKLKKNEEKIEWIYID